MPDNNTTCGLQHQQLLDWLQKVTENIGSHEAHITTSLKNQEVLFDRLQILQSTLDKRVDLPGKIDRLTEVCSTNRDDIGRIQTTLENGLTAKARSTEAALIELTATVQNFISNHNNQEAKAEAGVEGWLRRSWYDFSKQIGPVIICIAIGLICWATIKAVVFKELPFPNYPLPAITQGVK